MIQVIPLLILPGLSNITNSSVIVNFVTISFLFWPAEPFHAFEMGMMVSFSFWGTAIFGVLFAKYIDSNARKNLLSILFLIRITITCLIATIPTARGLISWGWMSGILLIGGCASGLIGPIIFSLASDLLPTKYRGRFFGLNSVIQECTYLLGALIGAICLQFGIWRYFYLILGLLMVPFLIYFHLTFLEPKRGTQTEELHSVLRKTKTNYHYAMNFSTMKRTMLSPTNIAILLEGLFISLFFRMTETMVLPYIQTSPHNLSPVTTMVLLLGFGIPGSILGQVLFAKKSDLLGQKKTQNRVYLVLFSLSIMVLVIVSYFYIPIPALTIEQGEDIAFVFQSPILWLAGGLIFSQRSIKCIYDINQPAFVQGINLPEAQAQIRGWKQFLESLGQSLGPIIAGVVLLMFQNNYQTAVLFSLIFAGPCFVSWIFALWKYPSDIHRIKTILSQRARELEEKYNDEEKTSIL